MTEIEEEVDGLTLEEYLASLTDADRQVLTGFPLTVDEFIDLDLDGDRLNELKTGTELGLALTEEQQAKRVELIDKIMRLYICAVMEDEARRNEWFGHNNGNGKSKSKTSAKAC